MGKIKINLESGAVVEKPLIIAFQANNFEYVILDNEMNGSMGLPIILVCKLENGKLIKIEDQNEWQIVKEYLKNIIAGSGVELVKVASVLPANDVYYTQLTLPVPSFDSLKKAYTIAGSEPENNEVGIADINVDNKPIMDQPTVETPASPVVENATPASPVATPTEPTPEAPIADVTPTIETSAPQVEQTPVVNETPNVDTNNLAETPAVDLGIPSAPVMDNPAAVNPVPDTSIDLNAPIPVFGDIKTSEAPKAPEAPETVVTPETPTNVNEDTPAPALETPAVDNVQPVEQSVVPENEPVVSITPDSENESPFKEQKEAFMQACENMFDALVQKFEKELENNK